MSILKRLGHDTASRLVVAESSRHEEARYLFEGGNHLSSIYLAGYAAEMTIGAAYFRLARGFGPNRRIDQDELQKLLRKARAVSQLEDKSHPIDGMFELLIEDKRTLNPPAIEEEVEQSLRSQVEIVARDWGPKLRYRAIQATSREADRVLLAARGIIDHCPRH